MVTNTTTIISSSDDSVDYSLVYFPFLIIAIILFGIALGGKLKDKRSQIISTTIAFWGILEFFLYILMGILAFRDHDLTAILAVCLAIWLLLIITNIVFL